jgi:hypothetical protein
MKSRKHHNNKGLEQIKKDKCWKGVRAIARRLGIKYKGKTDEPTT